MIFLFHLIYALSFFIYAISLEAPPTEDYINLKPAKKRHFERGIYGCVVLVLLFPIMNLILRNFRPDAFSKGFAPQFIGAAYCAAMFLIFKRSKKTESIALFILVPAAYFIYTLVKNWAVMKSIFYIFDFLLVEVIDLVLLFVLTFVPSIVSDHVTPKTKAEHAQDEKEWKEINERWKAEKAARAEQKRLEEERRIRESQASYSDSSESSSYANQSILDAYDKKREIQFRHDSYRTCSSCSHYQGGQCTYAHSANYQRDIYNPDTTGCGFYSRY